MADWRVTLMVFDESYGVVHELSSLEIAESLERHTPPNARRTEILAQYTLDSNGRHAQVLERQTQLESIAEAFQGTASPDSNHTPSPLFEQSPIFEGPPQGGWRGFKTATIGTPEADQKDLGRRLKPVCSAIS